jgi:DNA-binding NtrC family response regulator
MGQKQQVMVVDDDPAVCEFLRSFLDTRGYAAITVSRAFEAVQRFHAERPAAVLLDLMMPGNMDGLAALTEFQNIDKDVPVIVISGQGRPSTIVQAMKRGATDFLCKPFEDIDLEVRLSNALTHRELGLEVTALREEVKEQARYAMLFGDSERMVWVRDLIERVSDTDVTILILGESGTGKELVARAVHERSPRRDRPFVKVNCAALPTELLESELFGFEKGAFTGAVQHKAGKFEFANQGTMFLDEIGEMSPPLQAKLLQVLQDGEFSRLGGTNDIRVDVRIIAATNIDLERAVTEGQFREDLYFRLNVVPIHLPPLRERREEIPLLTEYFLKKYSTQYSKPMTGVSADVKQLFMEYDWPGNVRQLENMINRRVVLGSETSVLTELRQPASRLPHRAQVVTARTVPAPNEAPWPVPPSAVVQVGTERAPTEMEGSTTTTTANGDVSLKAISRSAARAAERELILRILTRTHWSRKEAAGILGVSYKSLLYKIKESGLDKAS